MARNSKLTDERQAAICDALAIGVPRSTAAQAAGITERTLYHWLERGEAATRGKHFQFFQAVQAAENQAEMSAMAVWRQGMITDWRAAKEFLERRFPDKYALAKDRGTDDQGPREVIVVREDQLSEKEWSERARNQFGT
jgi:hypothetical protein